MSDSARKEMTPDSQKSMADKAKEGATSTYDQAAGAVQPKGDKSATQQLSDSVNETVSTKPGEKTYVEQAQDMATNVYNQAAGAVNDVVKQVQESTSSEKK